MGLDGVTWFRQAAFRWQGDGPVVYVDPWGVEDDVPADVILITHAHFDHLQPHEIERLRTSSTTIVAPRDVADELRPRSLIWMVEHEYEGQRIPNCGVMVVRRSRARLRQRRRTALASEGGVPSTSTDG